MRFPFCSAIVLVALATCRPAFAQVTQPAVVELKKLAATTATQTFEVKVKIFDVGGVCPGWSPSDCVQYHVTVRITPCPPGLSCNNGAYVYTYIPGWILPPQVTLYRQQEYTIDAHIQADVAPPKGGFSCYYTCFFEQEAVTLEFTPPPFTTHPEWSVATDSASEDSLWVSLRLLYADTETACAVQHKCNQQYDYGSITPPVLALRGATDVWNGVGTNFQIASGAVIQVALQQGNTYTLAGGHHTTGIDEELHGGCYEYRCQENQVAPERTIVATTTATRPITWGAVKSMYRD
jgi:hypothetical protein